MTQIPVIENLILKSNAFMSPIHGQKVSPTWLPKDEPNKDDTDKHVRMDGGKLGGLSPTPRSTGN